MTKGFSPAPTRVRVWDGERMLRPNCLFFNGPDGDVSAARYEDGDRSPFIILPTDTLVVLQSTGLRDANGVEVFDGDVLETKSGRRFYAQMETQTGCWMLFRCQEEDFRPKGLLFEAGTRLVNLGYALGGAWEDIRVVGNVFENPDMAPTNLDARSRALDS